MAPTSWQFPGFGNAVSLTKDTENIYLPISLLWRFLFPLILVFQKRPFLACFYVLKERTLN